MNSDQSDLQILKITELQKLAKLIKMFFKPNKHGKLFYPQVQNIFQRNFYLDVSGLLIEVLQTHQHLN